MEYDVYFDESGDLGWTLGQPYRNGGSSQFFVIAYIIIPTEKKKHINRFIKKIYKQRGKTKGELKGSDFRLGPAKSIARRIVEILERHKDFTLGYIALNKANAPERIKEGGSNDVIYNYMVQLGICSEISSLNQANIIPDDRSVPTESKNSCPDLIKTKLWLELQSNTHISYAAQESHLCPQLMFIDWVTNFIWRHYEESVSDPYQILNIHIKKDELFFD